jgi:DNA-binding response OmpR family regulator
MPKRHRILIVDDDHGLREALTEQLSLYEDFEAVAVDIKGVQAAKAGQTDLVIMDVGLPDIDGREAVRVLRKNDFKAPIIMLTGHIGPYTFRPSSKLLLSPEGKKVRLTEKETSVLRYLYRAGQQPVSRETLLQEVWGYNSGLTTHTVETHIYRLRQKIEKDAAAPAILVTEAGGYKLAS